MEFLLKLREQISLETIYFVFTILVATDVLTGMLKAWKLGRFKSRTLRDGLFGSMAELVALMLCIASARLIPISEFIVFVILIYMIAKELYSIIENLLDCGAKLPVWLISGLQIYTDKIDNGNKEGDVNGKL